MELMSTYLNGSSTIKVNPVSFANIFVSFTSVYGAKAILVTRKEDENFPKETSSASTQAESTQPPMKKRKSYSVASVIQQATFQGMERIIKCVDAHKSSIDFDSQTLHNNILQLLAKNTSKKDAVDSFLEQIGDMLRKLSYLRKRQIQIELLRLIHRAEDEELAEMKLQKP
ncbi:hypothetical protein G5I_06254 [Acromyrmex echinatior]|uniref:BESS domain-containing protein n=1 Tax=Acromyrmex echinatior TaxID=103372 RepID=F4WKJ2_ACREC|nr:hypothetical protein G5I_06254 [Acromyrmex echinatior]